MLKILGRTAGRLVWLVWFCLVRVTFVTWLIGLWLVHKVPALSLAIKNGPAAVPITLALVSTLVVCRFLVWLTRVSSCRHLSGEPPPKKWSALLDHKVGW